MNSYPGQSVNPADEYEDLESDRHEPRIELEAQPGGPESTGSRRTLSPRRQDEPRIGLTGENTAFDGTPTRFEEGSDPDAGDRGKDAAAPALSEHD